MGELINTPGGGAGLVVDYGDDRAFGSSFRVRRHKIYFLDGNLITKL